MRKMKLEVIVTKCEFINFVEHKLYYNNDINGYCTYLHYPSNCVLLNC